MINHPNIVIINPDQMRADSMFHLGNPASVTPNLDELANEGVSFADAFCQNPVCTPSRCSFMSGWYPHVTGHRTMNHMMHDHEPVLLKRLKEHNYHIWMNQRNDLLPAQNPEYYKPYCDTYFTLDGQRRPDILPYENWRGEPGGKNFYSFYRGKLPEIKDIDQIWTEGAAEFIRNYEGEKPFCLFLPLMLPHPVYQISEPYFSRIDRKELKKRILPMKGLEGKSRLQKELSRLQNMKDWKEEEYDELRAVYLGMCSKVDELTGQIVRALKEKGIYDETALFFFSDHGDYTGDYNLVEKVQNSFEDCLTNVPFIVKLPKNMQKRHGVSREMTELIDFYATVEELAELPAEHTHFGKSLIPYIMQQQEVLREAVFCEGGFRKGEDHCKETGGQTVPDPQGLYFPRQSLQASDDMYNGKAVMCRTKDYKYIRRLYEKDEFYDLRNDPDEIRNQIDCEEYRTLIAEMKERLLEFYQDTCDVVPFEKDARMDRDFMKRLMH
ncbi:sulfatase-like hydrolase/transferase [Clostridium boliviensis]|uniref:Sulfatase-like hydrolase/transferase n=1 Tax=Clostridium boliviensis TaxID=318465 RepID=A0ABU4GPP5_9CLOT|nr:sulfatase-like hydrolase/transferase [Clostridium boliviensis]MDW2798883.1 sulfatase-like hydrolase/transferase [Clostridium boliviensis]